MQVTIDIQKEKAIASVKGIVNSANAADFGGMLSALPGEAEEVVLA